VDFFARQEQSRRTTRWLVVFFALSFLAVALATTAVVAVVIGMYTEQMQPVLAAQSWPEFFSTYGVVLGTITVAVLALMMLASLVRSATLSRGGGQVARMLGATEISGEDPDPLHRRLINVVEEMAIASGVPVPEIYVLEQEPAINAFAAGLTHADAAVAVTRGTLERLNRAELQGVIAHEFSHILNGDMRLNQKLIGFGFGILVLSLVGRWLLRAGRFTHRGRGKGLMVAVFVGFGLTIIGAIGVLFSRLIRAAVSRQREALADASAVQFTREPTALADALKKIGGYTSRLSSVDSEEVAHMLFGSSVRALRGWFATHPPLIHRIRALDPSFSADDYPAADAPIPSAAPSESQPISSLADSANDLSLDRAGQMGHAEVGGAIRAALPEELYHAAHSRESSFLVVLALALSSEEQIESRQLKLLENQIGADRTLRCRRFRDEFQRLDRRFWLPVLEVCMPALKQRPHEQIQYLADLVRRLLDIDSEQQLFDYVLLRLLGTYLRELPDSPLRRADQPIRMKSKQAVNVLLGTVATFGHDDSDTARAAYAAGFQTLGGRTAADASFEPTRSLLQLDSSLFRLAKLPPRSKRKVLASLLATIRYDKKITIAEIELFRVIAATLGCPLPPAMTIRTDSP